MSAHRILTFTIVTLISTACNPFHQRPAVEVTAHDATLNTRWHANLASPASLAGAVQMNGTASMAPSRDSTSTDITLALANATHSHFHAFGIDWDDASGTRNGHFAPFAWNG